MFAYFNSPRLLQVVLTNQKSLGVCSHVGLLTSVEEFKFAMQFYMWQRLTT